MKSNPRSETVQRLRCAAGHLNAVIEMIEADSPCEEALHQLNAVQAALRAAGVKLLLCQMQDSQAIILNGVSTELRVSELKRLQSLYTAFCQYPNHLSEVTYE